MASIGNLIVNLTANAAPFNNAMKSAQRNLRLWQREAEKSGNAVEQALAKAVPASRMMASAVFKMGAVAGAALTGVGFFAIRAAASLEQTQIAFETLLGSAQEADRFIRDMQQFAAKTPFEFQGLAQSARQLLAFKFAAQDVLPMMGAIGDATAAMGGGTEMMDRVTRALGQIQAKGRAQGEELMQLAESGINAYEYLADAMGTGVPQVMEAVTRGAVDAQTAINAILLGMQRDFAGAMERQSRTILGQWSTFKDNVNIILQGLGQNIIQTFGIAGAMDAVNRRLSDLASLVSQAGWAEAWAQTVPAWVTPALYGIAGAIIGALVPALFAAARALWRVLVTASVSLLTLWPFALAGAAVALFLFTDTWSKLWNVVSAVVLYASSLVVRGVGLIVLVIGLIVPAARSAGQSILALADSLKASAGQSLTMAKTAAATADIGQQVAQEQDAIANAGFSAAEGQDQLADSTEKAAKAAADNIHSFDEVHQIQESMADSVPAVGIPEMGIPDVSMPEVGMPTMPGLGDITGEIGDQMASVADKAASAWDRLKAATEPFNRAVQWVKDNWPTIGPIIEGIANIIIIALVPALIKAGVEAMVNGAKMVASWVAQGAAALAHGATVVAQLLLMGTKWVWFGMQATIHGAKVVAAWTLQGWQAAASVATQVAQMLLAGTKWLWLGIQASIGAAQVASAWVLQRVQAIASVTAQISQMLLVGARWGWMGITAMANATVMAAAWFVALGPVAWVIATIVAVALAVALNWDKVKAKTIEIWEAVLTWLVAKWTWIKDAANSTWQGIKSTIQIPMQSVQGWLGTTWDNVAGRLAGIWDSIKTTASGVWNGVAEVIKGAINGIIGFINEFIRAFNRIKIRVPEIDIPFVGEVGGWTVSLPKIPEIPMLAEGGIVTAPTLAMIGEAGPEAVLPLSGGGMVDELARAMYRAVVDGFRVTQAGTTQGQDREVVLRIDSTTFARLILPAIVKEGQRQGLGLVVQPGRV